MGGAAQRLPADPSQIKIPLTGVLPRVSPHDSSPDAPWKDGRERSDRWKETPLKGFLPRVSDRTRRFIFRLSSLLLEFFKQLGIAVGHVGL